MAYKIKKQQYARASNHNVTIKQSTNKNKKIDVIKNGKKVASIGAKGYKDFATYIEEKGLPYARKRRKLYLERHAKEPKKKDGKYTPSFWSDKLLWG
tara:strand:+ start:179 stop:469 length:291 start_codon:yes stop_codon:yes gene_type:complete